MARPLVIETAPSQHMMASVTPAVIQETEKSLTLPPLNTTSQTLPSLKKASTEAVSTEKPVAVTSGATPHAAAPALHRASDTYQKTLSAAVELPQEAFPEELDKHSIKTLEDVIAYLEKNNASSHRDEGQRLYTETGQPQVTIQWRPHQAKDQLIFNTSHKFPSVFFQRGEALWLAIDKSSTPVHFVVAPSSDNTTVIHIVDQTADHAIVKITPAHSIQLRNITAQETIYQLDTASLFPLRSEIVSVKKNADGLTTRQNFKMSNFNAFLN